MLRPALAMDVTALLEADLGALIVVPADKRHLTRIVISLVLFQLPSHEEYPKSCRTEGCEATDGTTDYRTDIGASRTSRGFGQSREDVCGRDCRSSDSIFCGSRSRERCGATAIGVNGRRYKGRRRASMLGLINRQKSQ
jgi:hypothetical protein